jgi:hypothetical protein
LAVATQINNTWGIGKVFHHVKNLYFQNDLAGIGTLVRPGCQRVIEPVSHLFFINPYTKKVEGYANKCPNLLNCKNSKELF